MSEPTAKARGPKRAKPASSWATGVRRRSTEAPPVDASAETPEAAPDLTASAPLHSATAAVGAPMEAPAEAIGETTGKAPGRAVAEGSAKVPTVRAGSAPQSPPAAPEAPRPTPSSGGRRRSIDRKASTFRLRREAADLIQETYDAMWDAGKDCTKDDLVSAAILAHYGPGGAGRRW